MTLKNLVTLRSRRWDGDWDIPVVDFGGPVSAEDIDAAVLERVVRPWTGHTAFCFLPDDL
ncbi:hypothetical protein ACFVT5_24975 [Streptomyces sp. NPDC058001]|uniref:hypothetical protein n=1 Tax=Streptomyces sp. NPDC058001 TaxID=3346300 RepID=UPI0036E962BA